MTRLPRSTELYSRFRSSVPTTSIMASVTDPTFRSYSAEEAKLYAASRLSYSENIYNKILDHHTATGGKFGLLLDVGCGPGNATRDLALSFDRTIGADPGGQMIEAANALGGKTKSEKDIEFVVSTAEEISQIKDLRPGSVDLLTAAMAVSCV
jgi:SAM-dependent methyltransferase